MAWKRLAGLAALALTACTGGGAKDAHGDVCSADGDCGALQCTADLDAAPKDLKPLPLVCDDAAGGAKPGAACEVARDCTRGICLLAGACAQPCGGDHDCDAGEHCQPVFARGQHDTLQSLSACVARVSLPHDAKVDIEMRAHALRVGDNDVELAAAAADGATLYVLQHSREDWPGTTCRPPLCVRRLRTKDSDPRTLFDADADYATTDAPLNPVAVGDHLDPVTIAFPSGARSALSDAGYVATVAAEHAGDLRVTRMTRAAPGDRLDLNVFYVGALDWRPEGKRGPQLLSDALDVVDEILGQADIAIGDVRQILVPGELPLRGTAFPDGDSAQGFAVLQVRFGVYLELPGLLRLSAGANNSAVNLFFLKDIAMLPGDGEPEAEAGGIPGPLGMHGTGASGIAIATNMMDGDPQRLGRTLAHELGHYLGLFHTSEADGSVYDALADTPECRSDRDADGNGLDVGDCSGAGADNLMFWAQTMGTKLTPDQQAVLKRALVLQ